MSLLARFGLGRKVIGTCVVVFIIIFLASITLLPSSTLFIDGKSSVKIVWTGTGPTARYQETAFIRHIGAFKVLTENRNISNRLNKPKIENLRDNKTQESLITGTSSDVLRTAARGYGTTQNGLNGFIKTAEGVKVENLTRRENTFVSGANSTPASFHLFSPESIHRANDEICAQCPDSDCNLGCQKYQELLSHLNGTSVESGDARLHVIPVDPLSWFRKTEGNTTQYRALLTEMARSVKSAYAYRTFKGSDHVFVCLDGDGCVEFANDLSKTLTEGLGSRAIFAAKGARGSSSLQWPCPLRVIDLDREGVDDVTADVDHIVQRASIMIDRRNRWICADKDHPAVHWERMMKEKANGVIMKQYGFVICSIPKSGCTMTRVLMHKMSGHKDWNNTRNAEFGLHYFRSLEQDEKTAFLKNASFVRAAIVRHPISRLLSGYLDKIRDRSEYGRVPGVQACMKGWEIKVSPFHKFVHCLTKLHPNPDKLDFHFRIQSAFCNFRRSELDFVGKQGHLLPEMKEFGMSLNFWEEYGADGWGDGHHAFGEKSYQTRTHDSANQIWQYYTEDLMMKAYHYYKEDFDRFGFTVEEILATKPKKTAMNNSISL